MTSSNPSHLPEVPPPITVTLGRSRVSTYEFGGGAQIHLLYNIYLHQIIMMYTLNVHNVICQLHINKTRKKIRLPQSLEFMLQAERNQ